MERTRKKKREEFKEKLISDGIHSVGRCIYTLQLRHQRFSSKPPFNRISMEGIEWFPVRLCFISFQLPTFRPFPFRRAVFPLLFFFGPGATKFVEDRADLMIGFEQESSGAEPARIVFLGRRAVISLRSSFPHSLSCPFPPGFFP